MHPLFLLHLALLLLAGGTGAGLPDKGIFPEYTSLTTLTIPASLRLDRPWLRLDARHHVATLYDGNDAIKAWPVACSANAPTRFGELDARAGDPAAPVDKSAAANTVVLRESDLGELRARLRADSVVLSAAPSSDEDHDGDGIVDRLDVLLGARKLVRNAARYESNYHRIAYPGGDVPRTEGVCTDTIVRAFRNAGFDLQREVHEDILRAPRAYPMVEKPDANIDHRRVRVMLPWLRRHLEPVPPGARSLPGDVVLLDTFPSKSGPDHIGIVSDTERGGVLLVINNWTDGTVEGEMELLSWVPVTHRFRPRVGQISSSGRPISRE